VKSLTARNIRFGLFTAALLLGPGCEHRPRAPVLRNEPVYQNKREGFRLLVPEGWSQHAKAEFPPGRVEKERLLVGYTYVTSLGMTSFEASMADLPPSADLAAYLAQASYGTNHWRQDTPPVDIEVDGVPCIRFSFVSDPDKRTAKEAATFRRGERTYFFTGVFPASDSEAREAVRRAVASLLWKK
jgi:hypothetical protein